MIICKIPNALNYKLDCSIFEINYFKPLYNSQNLHRIISIIKR